MNDFSVAEIHYNMSDTHGKFFIIVSAFSVKKNKVAGFEMFFIFNQPAASRLFNSATRQRYPDLFVKILNKTRTIKIAGRFGWL